MSFKHIPEAFFHFLWKYRILSVQLKTIQGESISIIHPGMHNHDAGPDFICARVRIGKTLWAGNVEIHVKASDWYRHGHDKDRAYSNVILHVVAENDRIVTDPNGQGLQTLCIAGAFNKNLLQRYREISANLLWIPCMNLIRNVDEIRIISCVHSLAVERLRDKANAISNELKQCGMDWEECCYRLISKQFGAKVNTEQFEILAKTLSVRTLMKYHDNLFQLEALLFGQSGLLNMRLYTKYPRSLKKEHAYLSNKHQLSPMPAYLWKFLRLRPAGFPTIRIAQLAKLYGLHQSIFQEIIEKKDIQSLIRLFKVEASSYWDEHYLFDRKSKAGKKKFGTQSIQLLLINAIIPMIHLYGDIMVKPELCERAIAFLEILPPENNAVIRKWKSAGVSATNSLETQGLLQLKNNLCDNKSCLECSIGYHLLRQQS